jgi:alcohol dehydrogenase
LSVSAPSNHNQFSVDFTTNIAESNFLYTQVGIPATFEMCQKLIAPGGTIANIGVHGTKVDLHLEQLWDRNISITTRLVDTVTIPMLFKTVGSHKIDPKLLITHRFKLDKILDAYETFGHAAKTKALKVIIEA